MSETLDETRGATAVRLQEVAAAAKVSTITVSRCLHRPGRVSKKTREHVLAVAAELGYVPNRLASSLVSARSGVIGAIVPTISNPVHAETLQAVSDVLGGAGYRVLLGSTQYRLATERDLVETFIGHRVDGMILTGVTHSEATRTLLQAAAIPVVETFEFTPSPIDANVGFSNYEAGAAIVRYLLGTGRRSLAFVEHAGIDDGRMNARKDAFLDVCAQAGVTHAVFSIDADPGNGVGGEIVADIRAAQPDADAVVFAGHQVAVGAIRFAMDCGIDVPGSLAITGFGDSAISQWVQPALTTVRFPMDRMGEAAGNLLLARIRGEAKNNRAINLGFEILKRQSA